MAYEQITFEVKDGIGIMTLNRPDKMNAFTGTMMSEMIDCFDRINKDAAVPAAEKQTQMASAVTASGLSPERFNSIATAMNADSALQAKVGAAIQAKAPAPAAAAPAPAPAPAN